MNFPSPSLLEIHRICAMRYEETAVESKRRINGNKVVRGGGAEGSSSFLPTQIELDLISPAGVACVR